MTLQGTLISPLCCADEFITTHTSVWCKLGIIFVKHIVFHKSIASVLKHQHCWEESTVWWEVGAWDHCPVTGNASAYEHCCVLQFSYKPKDTKLGICLLISLRSLPGWKTERAMPPIWIVYSLCICRYTGTDVYLSLFLFSFWSRQEREGKNTATPKREDGLLLWLQPTGWVLLGLNLSRMSVIFGSSTSGQMESRTTASGDTLSTNRCWSHWWLELWTGGTSQLSLHVGAQFLGHPLSTDCVMWPEHDMASKERLWPNACGMDRTADPPRALPSPCPWQPTSEKLSTALFRCPIACVPCFAPLKCFGWLSFHREL